MSMKKRASGHRTLLLTLALGAVVALPIYASDGSTSWWDALLGAVTELFGDESEAGLSIEPGG